MTYVLKCGIFLLVRGAGTVAVDAALRRKVNKKAAIIPHKAPTITAPYGRCARAGSFCGVAEVVKEEKLLILLLIPTCQSL